MLAQALPRVKADAGDLDARMDCQIGTWLSMGRCHAGVPMGASHGIGYVLGAEFGVPHGYTSCVMLPSVMRWNKSGQCRAAGAGGGRDGAAGQGRRRRARQFHPRPRHAAQPAGGPKSGPSISTAIAEQAMANALGAAQPAQDRRPGAGARNSHSGRIEEIGTRCTPASMLICVRCSPPSSWRQSGETVTYARAGGAQQPAGASAAQPRPEAARPLFDLHGEQQPLSRMPAARASGRASTTPASTRT